MKLGLIALLLLPSFLFGTNFSAKVTPSNTTLPLDEDLNVTLELEFSAEYNLDSEKLFGNFQKHFFNEPRPFIIKEQKLEEKESEGVKTVTFQYVLSPQILGQKQISFYDINFIPTNDENDEVVIFTDIINIDVIPPDVEGIVTPYPPVAFDETSGIQVDPSTLTSLLYDSEAIANNLRIIREHTFPSTILLAVILFIATISGIILYKRKLVQELDATERALNAREAAIKSLEKKKPDAKHAVDYVIYVSDVIRNYIEKRYLLPAQETTTPEFLKLMSHHPAIYKKMQENLIELLQFADHVKFSKHPASLEDCSHIKSIALKLIDS